MNDRRPSVSSTSSRTSRRSRGASTGQAGLGRADTTVPPPPLEQLALVHPAGAENVNIDGTQRMDGSATSDAANATASGVTSDTTNGTASGATSDAANGTASGVTSDATNGTASGATGAAESESDSDTSIITTVEAELLANSEGRVLRSSKRPLVSSDSSPSPDKLVKKKNNKQKDKKKKAEHDNRDSLNDSDM